jgi:hypothetical protein
MVRVKMPTESGYRVHKHQQKLAGHQVVYSVTTSGGATAFDID